MLMKAKEALEKYKDKPSCDICRAFYRDGKVAIATIGTYRMLWTLERRKRSCPYEKTFKKIDERVDELIKEGFSLSFHQEGEYTIFYFGRG